MLKIGEFSRLSRLSIRMLRHYDDLGLLTPSRVDPFNGYRYYVEEQLSDAYRIAALREMGFGLPAVGALLRARDDPAEVDRLMAQRQLELECTIGDAKRQLKLLRAARTAWRKDDSTMTYDVTIKTFPERRVASARMILPNYGEENRLWSVLMSETAPLRVADASPCLFASVYHDGEFKEADVDVEVQRTVAGDYPDTAHVRFKTEPPVTVASAIHRGSYTVMGEANAAIAAWVRDNGYAMCGPMFLIYYVGPHETTHPDEFVTEVCYPVRKRPDEA